MSHRLTRQPGQTIVLMALVMLVLLAFVGMAIDVGNAYGQQRQDQAAATAASLGAMEAYLRGTIKKPASAASMLDAVHAAIQQNEIEAGTYDLAAHNTWGSNPIVVWIEFLDKGGANIGDLTGPGSSIPGALQYIRVTIVERVDTTFAKVVGRNDLTVSANAYAVICPPSQGVYPVTFDVNLLNSIKPDSKGGPSSEFWASTIKSSGNFGWLDWDGGSMAGGQMEDMWRGPGTLEDGFVEGDRQAKLGPASTYLNGSMDADDDSDASTLGGGDWIWGQTGVNNAVSDELNWHINHDDLPSKGFVESDTDWTIITLPLHSLKNSDYGKADCKSGTGPGTGNDCDALDSYGVWGDDSSEKVSASEFQYKVVAFGSFRLVRYNLNDGGKTLCNGEQREKRGFCLRYLGLIERGRACTSAGGATGLPPGPAPKPQPTAVALGCKTGALSDAQGYNQFIFGNLTHSNTDTEGRIAVGGNAKFSSYGVNAKKTGDPALVVDGTLSYQNGQVNGNVIYGALGTGTIKPNPPLEPGTFTVVGGTANAGAPPFSFLDTKNYLLDKSDFWSRQAANGTTDLSNGVRFTGTDTKLNIFAIDADSLKNANQVVITVPSNPTGAPPSVLINVQGANVTFPNGGYSVTGTNAGYIIYNLYEATNVDLKGGVQGSILAPQASVSSSNGHLEGELIAENHSGTLEIGYRYYEGCLPLP